MRRANLHRATTAALICLCALVAVAGLRSLPFLRGPFVHMEGVMEDSIYRASKLPEPRPDIVFLAIDEATLSTDHIEKEEIEASPILGKLTRGFPFSRSVYAEAVRKLCAAGVKVVIIDLLMPQRAADPEGDADLAFALDEQAGKVVLGGSFAMNNGTALFLAPTEEVLARTGLDDPRLGFVNFWPDEDGVVRHATFRMTVSEFNGRKPDTGEPQQLSMAAAALRQMGLDDHIPPGTGDHRLAFRRPMAPEQGGAAAVNPYPARSFYEIFVPALWKSNYGDGAFFKDKIVCIGPSAAVLQDFHATPLGQMQGPQLHLTALNCLLDQHFLADQALLANLTWLAAALLAWAVTVFSPAPWVSFAILAAVLPVWFPAGVATVNHFGFVPPPAGPLLTLYLGGLGVLTWDFARTRAQRNRLKRSLSRYVSRNVAASIVDHPDGYYASLGGQRRQVAVLFSDVRDFTPMTEGRDPGEVVAQLNAYLGRMVAAVFAHEGTLDKFIGDAVMAVWGNLESHGPDSDARAAVQAALDMQAALAELNEQWGRTGQPPLSMGIGVHYGPAIAGNIGSEERMEPTVIGDTVNLASRLEGLSKVYRAGILISGEVAALLGGQVAVRRLDRVKVKGRRSAVEIYEALTAPDRIEGWEKARPAYEAALETYLRGEFAAAAEGFAKVLESDPGDGAAATLRKRCLELAADPITPWDGAYPMTSK